MKFLAASLCTALLPGFAVSLSKPRELISKPVQSSTLENESQLVGAGLQRRAAIGDFEEFNELFEDASIVLPDDFEISQRVGLFNLDMTIQNLKCNDLSVGDIQIEHERKNLQSIDVRINVLQLDLDCEMNYSYTYGPASGDGWLKITTDNNSASTTLNFASDNFDSDPPNDSTVGQCIANIEIDRMDFEGDTLSEIVEIFQGLIRGVIERAIGKVACDELGSLGTSLVSNMLELASQKLEPYQGDTGEDVTDPLYLERNLDLPGDLAALDLQNTEDPVGKLFNQALEAVDAFMGTAISDSSDATSTGRDLAVNIFLRSYFLDDDRAFTLDASQLPTDALLFEGHDRLTETTITLNQVKIFGLDTLSRFNPFIDIGRRTLQNELTWDKLIVEFDVTVDIKPSSLDDAILQNPTSQGVSERINIDFGVDNVDVLASLLLVVDEEALGSLELGPLLHTDYFLPCLLSVVHETQLSGLSIDPQDVNEPTLNGFISPGIDRIITDATEAAFAMYTGVLRQAIPNIFQTSVRDFVNTKVINAYMSDTAKSSCPTVEPVEGFIDFRQFLAKEENIYGDLPPMLKNLFDSELLAVDSDTGNPRINEVLIAPLTKSQSGVEGDVTFTGDVFGFHSETIPQFGMDSVELRAFNPSIKNLDSMGAPLVLLEPNTTNGFIIENRATFGVGADPMRFSLKGLFALQGDPVLEMSNEMELSVDVSDSELLASLLAKVDAGALFSFPLRDVANAECWFATLAAPLLDENGNLALGGDAGLSLERILMSMPSVRFDVSCTNCTSPGLSVLPEVFELLEAGGVSDVLEQRLIDLGLDLLRSNYVQAYMNQLVADGSLRCPHSPTYVDALASSDYPVPRFPSLPFESLETVTFASTVLLHVATVVIAESHKSYDIDSTDPHSGQAQLAAEADTRLVDFTSLESSVGEWAGVAVDQLLTYLSAEIEDPKGPGGKDLRVNNLLRSTLLDENGLLDIEFNDLSIGGVDLEVALKHVRIVGLDSISSFNVLDAIGPQTLHNELKWERLGVQMVISLMSSEDKAGTGRSLKTIEDVTVSLELADIDVSLALLLAMDLDLLGSLKLSSMLEIKNILPCIISAARAANLTQLQVSVGSIKEFSIDGFRSSELSTAAAESSRIVLEKYGETILSSMPGFFDLTVRTLLNNWMSYYMGEWSTVACPSTAFESTGSGFVDFRDLFLSAAKARVFGGLGSSPYGDLFRTALGIVQDLVFKVDASTGLSAVNDVLVEPFTRDQSETTGSFVLEGDLFSGRTRVQVGGLDANIQLQASDARVDNLDTVGSPLALLEAMMDEPNELNNTVTFGVADRPLRFGARLLISIDGDDDMQVRNVLDVSLDLWTANVLVKAMMKVAESRFYGFPLGDILDANCWLAMIPAPTLDSRGLRVEGLEPTAALAELAASISKLKLDVSCVECSSPRMSELTELLSSQEAQDDATEVTTMLLDYITELMGGNFLQVQIDRLLNDAARKCPHSPLYEADAKAVTYEPFEAPATDYSTTYLILLGCVTIALVLVVGLLVLTIKFIVRRRHKRWLGRLPPHQVRRLAVQQGKEKSVETELNATTRSMFFSPEIPSYVRWSMPLIILVNIAFFLSGHLSLGATVNIEAELAGEKFRVEKFFEFSMAKSTIDIWNAGGRELAIMILVFSGIWPYTKQLMTLVLWFLPPSRCSISRRGSILLWLDWLAKWSMIDIFVLVISIAAFRVSIVSPDVVFLPEDFYSINMLVVPLWGLYANMIAQLISQVSSHFVIHYHRRIVTKANEAYKQRHPPGDEPRVYSVGGEKRVSRVSFDASLGSEESGAARRERALRKHQFSRPHRGETETLVVRTGVNHLLWLGALSLLVLVVIGCAVPSFSLEILGIVGVAVESGQGFEDATTHHSVFTVIKLLMEEARFLDTAGDYIGLGTLSVLLVSTVLLIPIVQSLALLRQWFSPSTRKQRLRMSIFIEILQAWQYAEVYLLAVFVASWQLGPISEFMINSYCDSLKDSFAQMVYYGILKEEDAQCFSVKSSIEGGSFVLAAGAVLLALLNTFVTKAVLQYFRDKDAVQQRVEEDVERMSENTSNTEDEDAADGGFSARIHPVPVLFTDTFRWMLRTENGLASSSRALFADPESEHWGLPEARAVALDDDIDRDTIEGRYAKEEKDVRSTGQASVSTVSKSMNSGSPIKGKRLSYRSEDEKPASRRSMNDEGISKRSSSEVGPGSYRGSINSQMGSVSKSFRDEPSASVVSEARSTSGSVARSTAASVARSTASSDKVPTEAFEEEMTLDDAYGNDEITEEDPYTDELSEYMEETVDDFEEYTVKSMSDIAEEDFLNGEDYSAYDSRSGRRQLT